MSDDLDALFAELETKVNAVVTNVEEKVRYVRTPEGSRKYGQPIGTIIVRDAKLTKLKFTASVGEGPNARDRVRGVDNGKDYVVARGGKGYRAQESDTGKVVANETTRDDVYVALDRALGGQPEKNDKPIGKIGLDASQPDRRTGERNLNLKPAAGPSVRDRDKPSTVTTKPNSERITDGLGSPGDRGDDIPEKLTYEFLQDYIDDEDLDDLEVALTEKVGNGDESAADALDDLDKYRAFKAKYDAIVDEADGNNDADITKRTAKLDKEEGIRGLTTPTSPIGDITTQKTEKSSEDGRKTPAELDAAWDSYVESQLAKAREATRGIMLNRKGALRNIPERAMIDGLPARDVARYASEELLEFFETNRRHSKIEYIAGMTGQHKARAARSALANSKIGRDTARELTTRNTDPGRRKRNRTAPTIADQVRGTRVAPETPDKPVSPPETPAETTDVPETPETVDGPVYADPNAAKTGTPITLSWAHRKGVGANGNTGDYGQDIEPAGKYISAREQGDMVTRDVETGTVTFQNPLVLDFGDSYRDANSWKKVLSAKYDGKTGKALSAAVRADGHDGIITRDKSRRGYYFTEIVDLTGTAAPTKPATPAVETPDTNTPAVRSARDRVTQILSKITSSAPNQTQADTYRAEIDNLDSILAGAGDSPTSRERARITQIRAALDSLVSIEPPTEERVRGRANVLAKMTKDNRERWNLDERWKATDLNETRLNTTINKLQAGDRIHARKEWFSEVDGQRVRTRELPAAKGGSLNKYDEDGGVVTVARVNKNADGTYSVVFTDGTRAYAGGMDIKPTQKVVAPAARFDPILVNPPNTPGTTDTDAPTARELQDAEDIIGAAEVDRITGGKGLNGATPDEARQIIEAARNTPSSDDIANLPDDRVITALVAEVSDLEDTQEGRNLKRSFVVGIANESTRAQTLRNTRRYAERINNTRLIALIDRAENIRTRPAATEDVDTPNTPDVPDVDTPATDDADVDIPDISTIVEVDTPSTGPEGETELDDGPSTPEEADVPTPEVELPSDIVRNTPEALPGEKFPPTQQQQDVIDAVLSKKNVLVQAKAGAGKTTTLEAIARRIGVNEPDVKIAYIAFNKTVQVEADARMPGNVESKTGHAVAWAWATQAMKTRKNDKYAVRRPDDVASYLGLRDKKFGGTTVEASEIAQAAVRTVATYANTAEDDISEIHLPASAKSLPKEAQAEIVATAQRVWDDLKKKDGKLRFTLDHMRKMWALSRPDFSKTGNNGLSRPVTVLFLDEAQDTPPVLAKVIEDQTIRKVIVGDADQAIYGFTGATDYLSKAKGDIELPLDRSWRFGPEIADIGNRFLQMLESKGRVVGAGGPSELVENMTDADAILVRSNGGLITEILREQEKGRVVGVPKNTKTELASLAKSAKFLIQGGRRPETMHDDLAAFRDWDEVLKEVEKGDDLKLVMLERIIRERGVETLTDIASKLIEDGESGLDGVVFTDMPHGLVTSGNTFQNMDALRAAGFNFRPVVPAQTKINRRTGKEEPVKAWTATGTPEQRAAARERAEGPRVTPDVTISTAHKAKGLEWNNVRIGDDFKGPKVDPDTDEVTMPDPEELRLAYVAVTRAHNKLDPGSLAYVFDYSTANGGDPNEDASTPDVPDTDVNPDVTTDVSVEDAVEITEEDTPDVPEIDDPPVDTIEVVDEPTINPVTKAGELKPGQGIVIGGKTATVTGVDYNGVAKSRATQVLLTWQYPDGSTGNEIVGKDAPIEMNGDADFPDPDMDSSKGRSTGRPALYTYQRRQVMLLGLDRNADPELAEAARRIRTRQRLTVDQSVAMRDYLLDQATSQDLAPGKRRSARRIAAAMNAVAMETGGKRRKVNIGRDTTVTKGKLKDMVEGDDVAFRDSKNGTVVGKLIGRKPIMRGRLYQVAIEREDGTRYTALVSKDTVMFSLGDKPAINTEEIADIPGVVIPTSGPQIPEGHREVVEAKNLRVGDTILVPQRDGYTGPVTMVPAKIVSDRNSYVEGGTPDDEGWRWLITDVDTGQPDGTGDPKVKIEVPGQDRPGGQYTRVTRGADSLEQPLVTLAPDLDEKVTDLNTLRVGDRISVTQYGSVLEGRITRLENLSGSGGKRVTLNDEFGNIKSGGMAITPTTEVTRTEVATDDIVERINKEAEAAEERKRAMFLALNLATPRNDFLKELVGGSTTSSAAAYIAGGAMTDKLAASKVDAFLASNNGRNAVAALTGSLSHLVNTPEPRDETGKDEWVATVRRNRERAEQAAEVVVRSLARDVMAKLRASADNAPVQRPWEREQAIKKFADSPPEQNLTAVAQTLIKQARATLTAQTGGDVTPPLADVTIDADELKDRAKQYLARIGDPKLIGKRVQTVTAWADIDFDALERGEQPDVVERTVTVAARAADGGPDEKWMEQLNTVKALGAEISGAARTRQRELLQKMGYALNPGEQPKDFVDRLKAQITDVGASIVEARTAKKDEAEDEAARELGYANYDALREAAFVRPGVPDQEYDSPKRQAANNKLQDVRNDVMLREIRGELSNDLTELHAKKAELMKQRDNFKDANAETRRQSFLEALSQVREMGFKESITFVPHGGVGTDGRAKKAPMNVSPKARKALEWAQKHYPASWREAWGDEKLQVAWSSKGGAFYQQKGDGSSILETGASYYNGGHVTGNAVKGDPFTSNGYEVAIHELSHGMEYRVPGLREMEEAFVYDRTSSGDVIGERVRDPLTDPKTGRTKFGKEWERKDNFTTGYIGRDYLADGRGGETNRSYENRAYETMQMAIQSVFAGSPYLDGDIDYENWALGTLAVL